jgi:hypothetical protein
MELKILRPPRLRSAITTQMQSEAMIELTGRGAPSTTLMRVNQLEKGRPLVLELAWLLWQHILKSAGRLTHHERMPILGEMLRQPH